MFYVATISILISFIMVLIRLFLGPTLYDRVLALNAFGTLAVLMISVVGFLFGRPDFLDIALLYALLNLLAQSRSLNSLDIKKLVTKKP